MVEIKPFRGYTYNPTRVQDISSVIAPPWDVVNSKDEESLRTLSEWNIIHIISGSADPLHSKSLFEKWIREEILVQDKEESFYFSRHHFKWLGKSFLRRGIFALLHIEDFSSGNIIPHEKIFEKYYTNRYKLIEKCRANFSPVFMLYDDETFLIEKIIDDSAVASVGRIGEKEYVDFGRIRGTEEISRIKSLLTPGKLIIADGHHRYQGALQYYKDNPDVKNGFILVFLVNIKSPQLLILPTHRYIPSGVSFIENKSAFEKDFDIERVPSADTMFARMQQSNGIKSFGIYEKGMFYIIRMRENFFSGWESLDTVILHNFIFAKILRTEGDGILYHQSTEYLLKEYRKTGRGVIFFLNPVEKKQFLEFCIDGHLMPQKTTYFYPKVPSGLVINRFDP